MNVVNGNNEAFDINIPYVRDAILYYTIQQYFNNNDKKTCEFIQQIEETHNFDFHEGLKRIFLYYLNCLTLQIKNFTLVMAW